MATERRTSSPEAWRHRLNELNVRDFPTTVALELTKDSLGIVLKQWRSYNSTVKLSLLFSMLCIKKLQVKQFEDSLTQIINFGCVDEDEWIRQISKILRPYPKTLALDFRGELIVHPDAIENWLRLGEKVRHHGTRFRPAEYPYIHPDLYDITRPLQAKMVNESPYEVHDLQKLRQDRLSVLNSSTNLTSNTVLTGAPASTPSSSPYARNASIQSVPNTSLNRPPMPTRVGSTSSSSASMFIPRRRQSYQSQPTSRLGPISTAKGSSGVVKAMNSPTDIITTGKTFPKQSKIQMLDISVGSSIIKNQQESIKKTQMEEQSQKEKRQRERNEKIRQREEARLQKETEKKQRAAARMEAQADAANNAANNAQGVRIKKRKINSVAEDVSLEEPVSDSELPHKTSQLTITSPTSPTSPPPTNVPKNEEDAQKPDSLLAAVEQVSENTQTQLSETNILPKEQIDSMVQTVLNNQCGLLSEEDKATIIKFLEKQFTLGNYGGSQDTLPNPGDSVLRFNMHETRITDPILGKETRETIVFEMNLTSGKWRKLKKKIRKSRPSAANTENAPNPNEGE
ncbi:7481_t:CDS:2 [Paraglomus brasilianum]|uniref:7481_t:CDS:1 n=1 Tax=Paraglomus brasilianum TaxID=144538 RepID=A0A9N8Z5N9_9GLOM|nr:7481_t:CDS:2 [Paraglomus brasilianum]